MTNEQNNDKSDQVRTWDFTETVIESIGGTIGRYQILCFILFALPFALSGSFGLSYVFTSLNLDYRCRINGCDNSDQLNDFEPDWLVHSIPYTNGRPANCLKFPRTLANFSIYDNCTIDAFDRSITDTCDGEYVYKTNDITILNEFNLNCKENEWKLAMVGTVNNIGRFIFTPVMGHLSDKFGRKTILIAGVFGSSTFAMIRSFSINYPMFLIFEFLDSSIGSATYAAGLILSLEWVSTKDRVLLGMIITGAYPLGQIFLGLAARHTNNFRDLLRIIYAPGFLILAYIWITPESIRWLYAKQKYDELKKIVMRAAKMNNIELNEEILAKINTVPANIANDSMSAIEKESITKIFTSRYFLIRFGICCFCWMSNAFVSYGVSLTSVSLAGDKYTNFMIVALAGVPAVIVCYFMLEHLGRRKTLCSALIIGGAAIISSKSVGSQMPTYIPLMLFFIGKCFIAVSFSGLYIFTTELWPTSFRHSMMSLCSSVGRVGSMMAPLAPLLSNYMDILPYLTFGLMAILSGILVLQLPETVNRKLPDTLEEAKRISRKINQ